MLLLILYNLFFVQAVDIYQYKAEFNNASSNKIIKKTDSVISTAYLHKIDSVAEDGINKKAFPGCQIYVSYKGKVIVNKSYGYHTYSKTQKVSNTDLYDIASVTKIAATTLCLMKLVDDKKVNIDDKLSKYLPYLIKTNKENISIREVLAHQAGFKSWIPFYKRTLQKDKELDSLIFRKVQSSEYSTKVADGIYIRNNYRDTILKEIVQSDISKEKKYLYSDLGFYLLAELIKRVSAKSIDEFVDEFFYIPMSLKRITFCPKNKFDNGEIIPTEKDTIFRKQQISGYVHDPGAAMLGGVSGHAGLFADASDLGVLMQMLLQNGFYKGRQYLSSEVIKEFTRCQYPENFNRRGLGFDKASLNKDINGPSAVSASKNSYGHSGFTGCFVWVDPDYKLVYVFLSNRICPDANNHKISEMNIRTNIQELLYKALKLEK